jgi:F0F1-type ATP synthase membrane subunit b/b'
MKQKIGKIDKESLIPSIQTEEKRIEGMLEEARRQAERMKAEAEREAAESLERAETDLPQEISAEREKRLAALKTLALEERRARSEETRLLEQFAAERLPGAVSYIVSRVWPRDPA